VSATSARALINLIGWLAGTGEVFLILELLNHPVSWVNALLLESLGQAIRGAAFAVPGALGVQEGGYLLLAPLAGLPPDMALALSLAKRAREIILGLPGLLLGPFVGALLGELAAGNSVLRSTHVGVSAWIGLIFGTIVKLVASLMMVALFGAGWWWNRSPS